MTHILRKGAAHVADIKAGGAFGAGVVTKKHRADGGALNDYTCGGGAMMEQYLKHPEVVKALHVKAGTAGMRYVRMRIFFGGGVACLLIAFFFLSLSSFLLHRYICMHIYLGTRGNRVYLHLFSSSLLLFPFFQS